MTGPSIAALLLMEARNAWFEPFEAIASTVEARVFIAYSNSVPLRGRSPWKAPSSRVVVRQHDLGRVDGPMTGGQVSDTRVAGRLHVTYVTGLGESDLRGAQHGSRRQ